MGTDTAPQAAPDAQRLDRWLWCARFFKTRSLATAFISDASIRLSRGGVQQRVSKPSFQVRPGDELCFTLHRRLIVLTISACGVRRGPASEAQTLYIDQSPKIETVSPAPSGPNNSSHMNNATGVRDAGAGRPTKRERRAMDRLRSTDN